MFCILWFWGFGFSSSDDRNKTALKYALVEQDFCEFMVTLMVR
jgi:hypothetical protein